MLRVDFQGHRRESRGTHRHISLTNSTVLGVYRGDFDMVLANQTEALVFRCSSHPDGSDRGISDGYVVHLSLSERAMWCCGGKNRLATLLLHCSVSAAKTMWL